MCAALTQAESETIVAAPLADRRCANSPLSSHVSELVSSVEQAARRKMTKFRRGAKTFSFNVNSCITLFPEYTGPDCADIFCLRPPDLEISPGF